MKGTSLKVTHSRLVHKSLLAGRQGQSLVEAIVAIGITVLVITGLMVLAVGAVRSATLTKNRSLAVQYAQEGLEALRSVRDRDFAEVPVGGGTYPNRLVWTGSAWSTLPGKETITASNINYNRSFTSTLVSAGKLKIAMTAAWTDSAGAHTVDLTTYLTDWQ